jgi:RNA polymerase sigma factor (sigma-70 family)
MSDAELLRRYASDRSQTAFAELVNRHLDLVYSAARRQVRSPQLAEEVAQSVFVDLARHPDDVARGTPLIAWLHVVTRRTAIDFVRRETRRATREREAALLMKDEAPSSWPAIEPLLDEAVESLDEADRTAILLRYFQEKSLREVGAALGTNDDAAQKRVSRALDELRAFFARRGVITTAMGLATDFVAHAAQAAPAGLTLAITNAVTLSTAGATAASIGAGRVLIMTTLQKSIFTAAVVLVGSAGVYESLLAAQMADDVAALRARIDRTAAALRAARNEHDATAFQLQNIEQQIDARLAQAKAVNTENAALVTAMASWLTEVDELKQAFTTHPQARIPEFKHLDPSMWFEIAGGRPLKTDEDLRRAMADIRRAAEGGYSGRLSAALRAYVNTHNGELPNSAIALSEYLDPPVEREILERYEMLATGKYADVPPSKRGRVIGVKNPPDPEFDAYSLIGPDSHGSTGAIAVNMTAAVEAYMKEHPGERPTSAAEVRPFLRWPMSDEAVQKNLDLTAKYSTKQ